MQTPSTKNSLSLQSHVASNVYDFQPIEMPDGVEAILTPSERVIANSFQYWTHAPLFPATVVVTDRRLLIGKPGWFGSMHFDDFLWRDGLKIHVQTHAITASLTVVANCREVDGECQKVTYKISGLEKTSALRVYSQAQYLEEQWREFIRAEEFKRLYAQSGGTVINAAAPSNSAQGRLDLLQSFYEQDKISNAEYEALKADLLSRM